MITKFSQDYTVILIGDLNSSLHRNKGIKRDRLLGKFKEENHLFLPVGHLEQSTFFHHNKRDTSQIDYFLCNKQSLVTSVAQEQRNPQNTSCHDPVKVKIQVKFTIIQSKIEKVPRGIRGEKSSKDMASSRNLVSTIGALASPKMGDGTRCPEG